MFFINSAKFSSFSLAATVAIKHAQQRNESCKVRDAAGTLLADFYPSPAGGGSVSIAATDYGRKYVEYLAR